jgi:hypothetical protein
MAATTTITQTESVSDSSFGYAPSDTSASAYDPIVDGPIIDGPPPSVVFDPARHLAVDNNIKTFMWEDLGYAKDHGITPIAVCQPFQLFTEEAVQIMRAEIFRKEVMEKYRVSSTIAAMQVRGYVNKCAPFISAAWKHPKTMEILSKVAGIDLAIRIDHEIGHLNFSVKSNDMSANDHVDIASGHYKKEREVVGWHYDSYPFSTVTMLSDSTNMDGGETVLQLGDGTMLKLNRAKLGQCIVLQGRYALHKGLTASAGMERISMVTSLWPASPHTPDESFLTNIRTVSNNEELYVQFAEYRFGLLEERFRAQVEDIKKKRANDSKLDPAALKEFIAIQIAHLNGTAAALLEEEKVERGLVHEALVTEPVAVALAI